MKWIRKCFRTRLSSLRVVSRRQVLAVLSGVSAAVVGTRTGNAILVPYWDYELLFEKSDYVAVCEPMRTRTVSNSLLPKEVIPYLRRTTMRVHVALKGEGKMCVVEHIPAGGAINERFADFGLTIEESRKATDPHKRSEVGQFLCFFQRMKDGTVVPTSGLYDSADSVFLLTPRLSERIP